MVPDAGIVTHPARDVVDVRTHQLAEQGDFIDIGDFQGQKIVGGVFNHLRAFSICYENRGIKFLIHGFQKLAGFRFLHDDNTGGVQGVPYCGPLGQKFRVRGHMDVYG